MAQHAAFTVATDVNAYFCDPKSWWQRGTNESTTRLLGQYFLGSSGNRVGRFRSPAMRKPVVRTHDRVVEGQRRLGRVSRCRCRRCKAVKRERLDFLADDPSLHQLFLRQNLWKFPGSVALAIP